MIIKAKTFLRFKSSRQTEYLDKDDFTHSSQKEKIEFLKVILKEELAAETTVCALFLLKELYYPDRYFFRRFLFHKNEDVSDAARKIIKELNGERKHGISFVEMLREGNSDDQVMLADYFISQKGKLNEKALLAFLSINDIRVRDIIVKNVTPEHEVDDALLSKAITSGAAWYVRSALVEILGNRKSQHLFNSIDFLMGDKNVEVKLKLIDALSKLGAEKGKLYLQQLARDSYIWIRKHAYRALQGS
jgi:hypothetical protein